MSCEKKEVKKHVRFLLPLKGNSPFMKKIPAGAEVNNVLVGEVDFLDKPVCAFVRLSKSSVLGDFAEVRLPSRFVFVLLGPKVFHNVLFQTFKSDIPKSKETNH